MPQRKSDNIVRDYFNLNLSENAEITFYARLYPTLIAVVIGLN
jgi:hypothetical protein